MRPPELVSQGDIDIVQVAEEYHFAVPRLGLRLGYTSETDPTDRTIALDNSNPYVRYHFRHVVVRDKKRVRQTPLPVASCVVSNNLSACPLVNSTYKLQGTIDKYEFEFLEILVDKCQGDPSCAPMEEINEKLQSGEFRIRAQLNLQAEQFDVERYHEVGVGSVASNRSLETFNIPNIEVQNEIIFKARKVSKEQRYIGSPPMPEVETNVLSFNRREMNYRPRTAREKNLVSFIIRIDDNIQLEEVSYWCPSILDLFGLWGAMASFIASLSIGFIAMAYNKWSFERHFKHMTLKKRREAQMLTLSAMEWMREKEDHLQTRSRKEIYKSLQSHYDALVVEPDIRLFESHHFDYEGRVEMSAAELNFPTTAFGELRRIAILEHGKKKRAALFLSLWYGRLLVKKGFITDPARRRELFSPLEGAVILPPRKKRTLETVLRRRRRTEPYEWQLDDIEAGEVKKEHSTGHEISSDVSSNASRNSNPHDSEEEASGKGTEHDCDVPMGGEQAKAARIIAELDPLTKLA